MNWTDRQSRRNRVTRRSARWWSVPPHPLRLGVLIVICCGMLSLAEAQEDAQPARGNPEALTGRDSTQGVYVRDSAVAVEKLALAQRLEQLRQWDKSADVYMEILEGYPDRVVPSQVDRENRIYQYSSVASAVQERLAKWPPPGLEWYRARYEHDADSLLSQANDDPARLHRIVALYFVTDSARQAALRLMDLYLEDGDFPAAAWLGDRLLTLHPTLGEQRARVLFRTALAFHLAGDAEQAARRLEQLRQDFPDIAGVVRGQEVNLAETLSAELQNTPPRLRAGTGDSWPTAFGSYDRTRVPQASASFGARLYSVELSPSSVRAPVGLREVEGLNQQERERGSMTGVMPVVDAGEMFFHDNASIYAVSLESGTTLPGWAETYSGDRGGRFSLAAWSTPRGLQHTLTVTEDAVYAVMALPDVVVSQRTGAPRGESRLVCLDRRTGRERWIASARSLPADAGLGRNLDFSGCPVVVQDTVYVTARGGKGMQFEDAYVMAFDAATGKNKWICYLASANSGIWEFGDFSGVFAPRVSHLTYWGGRLYAMTNIGALASIDAYDGTIAWLNLYPRDIPEPNRMGFNAGMRQRARGRITSSTKPWTFNPPMISGGKVFAIPSDGLHVLIYDAATGVEEQRIPLAQFDDANTLLGIVENRLIIAGDKTVYCIDWQNYDGSREADANLVWAQKFMKGGFPEDAIRGRGFVTADSVYVPTAWALLRIALKSGAVVERYPAAASGYGDEEEAGNILAMQDRLIVAGPTRVNVYTDLNMAMAKLDAEVASAPDQPEPRLRYAEVMSVAGKWDVAIQKLDEAMDLIGAAGAATPSPARDRLFNDALAFAQRVARDQQPTHPTAVALFERAAAAAYTPAQQVNYRLTRARVMKGNLSPEEELNLYQQILADAQMREVAVAAGEVGVRPAEVVAERAITDLLARAGRAIYEQHESAASEALEAAQTEQDPEKLLAVARQYPNSRSAPLALRAAAERFEHASQPRQAAQMLRLLLFKYPESPDRALAIEALARNYLALPNRLDVAMARLAQGARLPGAKLTQPLRLPDGQVLESVSFEQALEKLRAFSERTANAQLPDMRLLPEQQQPGASRFLPPAPETTIAGVAALVQPLSDFVRNDRIVAYLPQRGLCVYEAGGTQPLFVSNEFDEAPQNVAWTDSTLLAWTGSEIVAFGGDGGQVLWKTALASLPAIEVVPGPQGLDQTADAEAEIPIDPVRQRVVQLEGGGRVIVRGEARLIIQGRQVAVQGPQPQLAALAAGPEQVIAVRPLSDRVIFCTSTGRLVAVDLEDGKTLWQTRPSERPAATFLASDDFVVLRIDEGVRVQILVFDALTGQFISRRNFSNDTGANMVPINMALAADGTLVWIMPDRVCAKDLFEPGDRLTFEQPGTRDGNQPIFAGAVAPHHLQIADGRIFVMSNNGSHVRVYSLDDGKPLRGDREELFLQTGARDWQAQMRVLGRRLYISAPQELRAFAFEQDRLAYSQVTTTEMRTLLRPRDLIIAQDYVVAVVEPGTGAAGRGAVAPPPRAHPRRLELLPISRAPMDETGRETGWLEEKHVISEPSGVQSWQPVAGGFYYLSGDQQLHFLRGARSE